MARTGAVILAAGAATRMGSIKQLLPYRGRTLIEHAIEQAQLAGFAPVLVVLGAQADAVSETVTRTQAQWILNENWQRGMGSSITSGVNRMLEIAPGVRAIAILLADQPHVSAAHLIEMQRVFDAAAAAPIVAASYAGTLGVPAIFGNAMFTSLQTLAPDAGARSLLRRGSGEVSSYELPEAAIDVDTPEEFASLL